MKFFMKSIFRIFSCFAFLGLGLSASAQEQQSPYSVELLGTFTHFEQQVKTEIGGIKGDLLAADTELSLQLVGMYNVWKFIHAGWYFQYDSGNRELAQFSGFDANGAAEVYNLQGGAFNEFWTGPIVRAYYKQAFVDVAYGLFGTREDDARLGIANESGSNEGSFTTDPAVAWMLGFGATVDICEHLALMFKAQYRVRYYDARDGEALENESVHGTQNFSPMLGISYRF